MHELPLVFFTVLTQSAVGAFIILLIGGLFTDLDKRRLAVGLLAMICLFSAGALTGVFHLGQPLRAINMLQRTGHSPMSNEIVLSAAFATLGGIAALGLLLKRSSVVIFPTLAWLAAIVGAVFLLAVPRIYQLPTVTTWSSSWTTIMMLLTPLISGGALAADFGVRRLGLWISILAIIVSFSLRPLYMITLMSADGMLTSAQSAWFIAQMILLATGMICTIAFIRLKPGQALLAASAGVAIAAELTGRIAFYNLWTLSM